MQDDVLFNKAAIIERCVMRVREEYNKDVSSFIDDYTRQDAAILNIQRACEACLDMAQHIVRRDKLGVPQSARDLFNLLESGGVIGVDLAGSLKKMVGFRNIAVHQYQELQLPITVAIINHHLDDFLNFSEHVLKS